MRFMSFNEVLIWFVLGGISWYCLWLKHKEKVKSFVQDNPMGQVAKKAATDKAISMIVKWLK